jgi:hypothetical protein
MMYPPHTKGEWASWLLYSLRFSTLERKVIGAPTG